MLSAFPLKDSHNDNKCSLVYPWNLSWIHFAFEVQMSAGCLANERVATKQAEFSRKFIRRGESCGFIHYVHTNCSTNHSPRKCSNSVNCQQKFGRGNFHNKFSNEIWGESNEQIVRKLILLKTITGQGMTGIQGRVMKCLLGNTGVS